MTVLFITNPLRKANLPNDYFIEQCSIVTACSTFPTFKLRQKSMLHNVVTDREKTLNIIQALDSNKVHS